MQALDKLADVFAGEIIVPSDPGYDEARRVWNAMADRRPALIVRPTSADDVATALRFARERDLVVAVRGGGHSIPGLSTVDDGIVIDLSRMRGAEVDPEQRLAKVPGGALLGDLDDAAQQHGLACPVGVVSHTGVGGLTLGGGMGRLMRRFGLTIDNLAAVELVTADGRQVRASEDENPELLWGLRGAGANFGIAVAFEFRLHPLEPPVTHGSVIHPIDRAADLAAIFTELTTNGPRDLWLSYELGPGAPAEAYALEAHDGPIASINVHHSGPPAAAERDLAELRAFGPPLADTIQVKTYLQAQHLNDEPQAWGRRFYMKSAFLPTLPDELVAAFVAQVDRMPSDVEGIVSIWAWGGAIADVPEDATAFSGREAAFWGSAEVMWEDEALDEASREWGKAAVAEMAPYALTGRYVNDVAESGEDIDSIYGPGKHARLLALKREWDPDNVFRLNQNIRP